MITVHSALMFIWFIWLSLSFRYLLESIFNCLSLVAFYALGAEAYFYGKVPVRLIRHSPLPILYILLLHCYTSDDLLLEKPRYFGYLTVTPVPG